MEGECPYVVIYCAGDGENPQQIGGFTLAPELVCLVARWIEMENEIALTRTSGLPVPYDEQARRTFQDRIECMRQIRASFDAILKE